MSTLKVAITGGNGLIGSALARHLLDQNAHVWILSRSGKSRVSGAEGVFWDPSNASIDLKPLSEVNAWVHLAGENIGDGRWTEARKRELRQSRVNVTENLVHAILSSGHRPSCFVSASGTGFYGTTQSPTDENSPKGDTFLAGLCEAWEDASKPLEDVGIRRVILRTGMVLAPEGGALPKMLTPFKLGVGGRLGSGDQVWNWIHLADLVRIYSHSICDERFTGVYNAVSPDSLTNEEFTRILSGVLGKPAILPAPAFALKLSLGLMAEELLLTGQNAIPKRLLDQGFHFDFPKLKSALVDCLGR